MKKGSAGGSAPPWCAGCGARNALGPAPAPPITSEHLSDVCAAHTYIAMNAAGDTRPPLPLRPPQRKESVYKAPRPAWPRGTGAPIKEHQAAHRAQKQWSTAPAGCSVDPASHTPTRPKRRLSPSSAPPSQPPPTRRRSCAAPAQLASRSGCSLAPAPALAAPGTSPGPRALGRRAPAAPRPTARCACACPPAPHTQDKREAAMMQNVCGDGRVAKRAARRATQGSRTVTMSSALPDTVACSCSAMLSITSPNLANTPRLFLRMALTAALHTPITSSVRVIVPSRSKRPCVRWVPQPPNDGAHVLTCVPAPAPGCRRAAWTRAPAPPAAAGAP